MGDHLFVVALVTLFMMFWIDIFGNWYRRFLSNRGMSERNIRNMMRIQWVILAIIFWYTLLHRAMPKEFTLTHFSFTLLMFSLYGLIRLFVFNKKGD